MRKNNLFDGDSYHAMFSRVTYKWFISRRWVTYADIMADYMMLGSAKELACNVTNCDNYGELKKSFRDVRNEIILKEGPNCIEEKGNNRNKSFRYIGTDDDPLRGMRNAKVIIDLRKYWKFCQDSAGLLPMSWLEYFFKDCQDLLVIKNKKKKGEEVISASIDRQLRNIELLPKLYEAIVNKQVLSINYKQYNGMSLNILFHPHFLKEYNGRWFLFGHGEDLIPEFGYNIAIDRIDSAPREVYDRIFVEAPTYFYSAFFKDIIGVSHKKGIDAQDIIIRAHTLYIFKIIETKPLHTSQEKITEFGEYEDGVYGDFRLHIEVNNEFIGRILQLGAELEVVAPIKIRQLFAARIKKMLNHYV